MNIIDHYSISEAINELTKIGENQIAEKLKIILENNELEKPEMHNKREDKTTSYYRVDLSEDDSEVIKDLYLHLEGGSLTEDGEAGLSTEKYASLLDSWSNID